MSCKAKLDKRKQRMIQKTEEEIREAEEAIKKGWTSRGSEEKERNNNRERKKNREREKGETWNNSRRIYYLKEMEKDKEEGLRERKKKGEQMSERKRSEREESEKKRRRKERIT